jgi:transcriptional regulator with XRE-family HTH domain
MTQAELAKRLGVGTTSVYNWCNGLKTPRMDKVDAMCEIFHCNRSDLMQDKPEEPYYMNDDAREIAQFLYENPDYKVLFDASRKVKPDDIAFVKSMLDRFKSD